MTFDEYNQAISEVFEQLQNIADRTANQALVGSANSGNPMFVALIDRHRRLVGLANEPNKRMLDQVDSNFEYRQ